MSSSTSAPGDPVTRAKVLRAVKGSAAAGGLSLAAVVAIAYPWANSVSAEQGAIKTDVGAVKSSVVDLRQDVGDLGHSIETVRSEVADVSKTATTVRDMKRSVEAADARLAGLEASRASTETSLRFIVDELKRMNDKLDRAIDRK